MSVGGFSLTRSPAGARSQNKPDLDRVAKELEANGIGALKCGPAELDHTLKHVQAKQAPIAKQSWARLQSAVWPQPAQEALQICLVSVLAEYTGVYGCPKTGCVCQTQGG